MKGYDDNALAQMMLLDACFVVNFMQSRLSSKMAQHWYGCLGVAGAVSFTARDIMVLENQIPFSVLQILIFEMYPEEGGSLLRYFWSAMLPVEPELYVNIPREEEDPPIHILEAFRRMLVGIYSTTYLGRADHCSLSFELPMKEYNEIESTTWISSAKHARLIPSTESTTNYLITCPSVMYMKAKGIRFRPSSHFLKDIQFDSHALCGQLKLPVCYVSDLTLVFLSNRIAYEISPDNMINHSSDLEVLSYVNFMKSLIQTPSDVRELQKHGILLLNRFGNLEQVVQLFKSIDTFTLRNMKMYQDVMISVREHCNSKAKTWMADLIHGKLKSPWTIIALLSATLLFCRLSIPFIL